LLGRARAFGLIPHKELMTMKPKNTICLWFDKDAQDAARFYAEPLLIRFLDNAMAWGIAESGKPCVPGK
jgi:hypothetical protein